MTERYEVRGNIFQPMCDRLSSRRYNVWIVLNDNLTIKLQVAFKEERYVCFCVFEIMLHSPEKVAGYPRMSG